MLFKTEQRGILKMVYIATTVIDIFKLCAHESVEVPAEVFFFCDQAPPTQASNTVKFNMVDRVQFLHLAASEVLVK